MSAVRAVIDTTELFEAILARLDTKTLLLSQRVERRWQQVIANSKPLQKKLFFLPTTTFDDILDFGFLDTEDAEKYNILDATSNRCKWLQQVVILNDLLFDTTREWKLRNVAFADPIIDNGTVTPSWKRMLLTQPPPSTGKGDVMFWFEDAHDNDELCEGMDTMGAMMDKVYSKEASVEGFNVRWDTAAVRPVKHAVDGTYYMRLLHQRQREKEALEAADAAAEDEELIEVTVFDAKGEVEENPEFDLPIASSSNSRRDQRYWGGSGDQTPMAFDDDDDDAEAAQEDAQQENTYSGNASEQVSNDDDDSIDDEDSEDDDTSIDQHVRATPASFLGLATHDRFYGTS